MYWVVLRHRPSRGASHVELRGETTAWADPVALRRRDDGAFEAELELPRGVFRYKLQHDDRSWHLDATNPRTHVEDGNENSVLVVGGTAEPLLHAPVAPWLFVRDDGRLVVRTSLRRGHGDSVTLRWNEGHGGRAEPMVRVGGTSSHHDFELAIPTSARRVDYLFALASGALIGAGGSPEAFAIEPRSLRTRAPEWWRDAVVYTVFVDRFRRASPEGFAGFVDSRPTPPSFVGDPIAQDEQRRRGGDLRGVIAGLDHLRALGVTTIHLTPPFVSPSAHRYDVIDFDHVDPALGGDDALRALLDAAHERDLRVILDVPFTHVSRFFAPFLDVRDRGRASPYFPWFFVHAHPFTEGLEPGYRYYQKGAWREPLLDLDEPAVRAFVVEVLRRWTRFGVDGFRIDAAAELPKALLAEATRAVRESNPEAIVFGEVVTDHVASWCEADPSLLHAGTELLARENLLAFLRGDHDGARFSERDARLRFRRGEGHTRLGFSTTHDHPRTLTTLRDPRLARLAHLAVATRPEIPALLYGDEVGLFSEDERGYEDVWPDRMPMPWSDERWDLATLACVRDALALRRDSVALRRGDLVAIEARDPDGNLAPDVLAFRRVHGDEHVDVLLHRGDREVTLSLAPGAPSSARVLLGIGEVQVEGNLVVLGARSGVVLAREPSVEAVETWRAIQTENERVAAQAFVEGWDETPSLPSRLYLTLTERCNLRCVHCITGAPARTADGTARTMAPWVVDALREGFRAARYVGFSHGGESLVHPDFFGILRTIQSERATRPGRLDVHLLSNGVRVDAATIERLVDHGVTSLAISLDGATRETQELIRLGGRFDVVLANVAAAVRARDAGADLRVGLSAVLTKRLVPELAALGRRCVELGVDWLKIEETVGVSHAARELLIAPEEPAVASAMGELRDVLEGSRVRLVDHLATPSRCVCVDASAREFRAADDFANRTSFRPCRMAWEQAVIDPDGAVRAIDYDHPIAGRLDERSLLAIWNAEVPRSLRRASLRAHARGTRERCVGS